VGTLGTLDSQVHLGTLGTVGSPVLQGIQGIAAQVGTLAILDLGSPGIVDLGSPGIVDSPVHQGTRESAGTLDTLGEVASPDTVGTLDLV